MIRRIALSRAACRLLPGLIVVIMAAIIMGRHAFGAPSGDRPSVGQPETSQAGEARPTAGRWIGETSTVALAVQTAAHVRGSPGDTETSLGGPESDLINGLRLEDTFGVQVIGAVGESLQGGGSEIRDAGARFVNFGIDWSRLAPLSTTIPVEYAWAPYDTAISETTALGLSVIATLGSNPVWAASYHRGPVNCVPLERWNEYVTAVVQRYKGSVRYWAIYNEPDGIVGTSASEHTCPGDPRDWADFGGHPAAYVEILRRAHDIIAVEDPNAVVLFGGIAYDGFTDDTFSPTPGPFVRDFLTDTLNFGAAAYFDVMNFHYYQYFDPRWEQMSGRPGLIGKTESVRSILQNHGSDRPIILTELGSTSVLGGETEDSQSRKVVQFFSRAMSTGIKVAVWYVMQDYGGYDSFGYHGLLHSDFSPKPSLPAYATLAAKVSGHSFLRPLAPTEWGASSLEGYVFQKYAEALQTSAVWTNDGLTRTILLPAGVFSVTDKYGVPRPFGTALTVDGDPVFILRNRMELHLPVLLRQ
jgi:hypothetical protein